MEVIHGLPSVGLAVDHKTSAFFSAAKGCRQFLGFVEQLPGQRRVLRRYLHDIPDVLPGDHQKVNRRLGSRVMKRENFIILKNLAARYFAFRDFTKNTIVHTKPHYIKVLFPKLKFWESLDWFILP
jgi:hypothetical protein